MSLLYHGVADDFVGTELLPLTEMASMRPDLYAKYLEKYKGREEILERQIPLLECGWNDVVQLLPLHPKHLFELQKQLGVIDKLPAYRYFQIDSTKLNPQNAVVYFKTAPGEQNVTVRWLSDINVDDLQVIPPATRHYYESMASTDEPVFNYQFVPHVLYRGRISVDTVPIIEL